MLSSLTWVLSSEGEDATFFSSTTVVNQLSSENQLWWDTLEEVRHHDNCPMRNTDVRYVSQNDPEKEWYLKKGM